MNAMQKAKTLVNLKETAEGTFYILNLVPEYLIF